MILEEETYEKFGYYSNDLKTKSNKKVLAACDICGIVRTIRKADYRSLCPSCVRKGKKNPKFGSPGAKNHWFGKKGKDHPTWKGGKRKVKCDWCGIEFERYSCSIKERNFCSYHCSRMMQKIPTRYTKPEMTFESIARENSLFPKYTGDGSLWIGKKCGKQLNPDFIIEIDSKRYVIEIFGDYWHSPLLKYNLKKERMLPYREKFYKKHGWHPIFIWESDLKRDDAEAFVLNLLRKEGVIK